MKNKIGLIDVNILSTYMGRWLTLIIALVVIGLTVSALLTRGGASRRHIIHVWVPERTEGVDFRQRYEPLRLLIAEETRRPTVLVTGSLYWEGSDLYILATLDYCAAADSLGLEAVAEVWDTNSGADGALLVARRDDAGVDLSTLDAGEIAFGARSSVNRFWLQLAMLRDSGFAMSADGAQLRSVGLSSGIPPPLAVLNGAYRVAACRQSDLRALLRMGVMKAGDLAVVGRSPALPETIVAAPLAAAEYFRKKVEVVGRELEASGVDHNPPLLLSLMRARGIRAIRPASDERIAAAQALFAQFATTIRSGDQPLDIGTRSK